MIKVHCNLTYNQKGLAWLLVSEMFTYRVLNMLNIIDKIYDSLDDAPILHDRKDYLGTNKNILSTTVISESLGDKIMLVEEGY